MFQMYEFLLKRQYLTKHDNENESLIIMTTVTMMLIFLNGFFCAQSICCRGPLFIYEFISNCSSKPKRTKTCSCTARAHIHAHRGESTVDAQRHHDESETVCLKHTARIHKLPPPFSVAFSLHHHFFSE